MLLLLLSAFGDQIPVFNAKGREVVVPAGGAALDSVGEDDLVFRPRFVAYDRACDLGPNVAAHIKKG